MAYRGSGLFVGIAAGYNSYHIESTYDVYGYGITFGKDRSIYCSVGPRYYIPLGGTQVSEASLAISPGSYVDSGDIRSYLTIIRLPSLQKLDVNNYTGYTGTIRVVSGIDIDEETERADIPIYSSYRFKCGLLVQMTHNT